MDTYAVIQKLYKTGRILSRIASGLAAVGCCGCMAGLLSLGFGHGIQIKIGGATVYDLASGSDWRHTAAALFGWLVVCAGETALAGFAARYFQNALRAGTPFTVAGAGELLRLGILTLAVPTGCAVLGRIAAGWMANFLRAENAALQLHFGGTEQIALGVMFIFAALLCRYGAESVQNNV